MTKHEPANENGYRSRYETDPNERYVREYLKKAMQHFAECKIVPGLLFRCVQDTMMKLLTGNPYVKDPNESDMHRDLHFLYLLKDRVDFNIRQYERGLALAEKQRAERCPSSVSTD